MAGRRKGKRSKLVADEPGLDNAFCERRHGGGQDAPVDEARDHLFFYVRPARVGGAGAEEVVFGASADGKNREEWRIGLDLLRPGQELDHGSRALGMSPGEDFALDLDVPGGTREEHTPHLVGTSEGEGPSKGPE